jgi:hypothetical protein
MVDDLTLADDHLRDFLANMGQYLMDLADGLVQTCPFPSDLSDPSEFAFLTCRIYRTVA